MLAQRSNDSKTPNFLQITVAFGSVKIAYVILNLHALNYTHTIESTICGGGISQARLGSGAARDLHM